MNNDKEESTNIIPIDIHYNKLLDWLIDRKHCKDNWRDSALRIREKINIAIQDMPENEEIKQLLSGTYINYFHCLKIIEILKVSESATKNIFGRYSSKRMKDWQEVVTMYQKDNIGLAEAADMLTRNVNYEIAASKRQNAKHQQQLRDLMRKESEYTSNAGIFRNKFLETCKQIGIEGKNIKAELMALISTLPAMYDNLIQDCKQLKNSCDFYHSFIAFVGGTNSTENSVKNDEDINENSTLPLLRYVIRNGNTTVFQWKTGQIPPEDAVRKAQTIDVPDEEPTDTIDFGELDTAATPSQDAIDFGDVKAINFEDSIEIDFGSSVIGTPAEEDSKIDFGDDINFDLTVDTNNIDFGASDDVLVTQDNIDDSAIHAEDLMTILDNSQTRNYLINDLSELQGFFLQRLLEMKGETNIVSVNQDAPRVLQMTAIEEIEAMKSIVDGVLKQFTSIKMQQLFLIKNSERYVDRLTNSLTQKEKLADKMLQLLKDSQERRATITEHLRESEPKLNTLISRTKYLQSEIATDLSNRYQNRPVNIMGEVNLI